MNEWPLVGRAAELWRLRRLIEDGMSRGVVLAGPAGAGKTRLALECLVLAEQAGSVTCRATATHSARAVPFGALAALLAPGDPSPTMGSADRTELLRRLAAALIDQAGGRRLVLLVDDAHLLDPASATLVHRLVETTSAFVLAVVRSGEPAPDAVIALWKDGLIERVEVGGLQAEAVRQLLEIVLDGPVDGAAAAFLAVRCEGNALFLRELILGAIDDGSLQNDQGLWRLTGQPSPSNRLVEIVQARLGALSDSERAILEYLAFGEPLGPLEIEALLDSQATERLESQFLVSSSLAGRRLQVRLAHPLYGDVLRSRLPALRLSRMARSLAEVVEGAGARRQEDVLRVATWRLSGGGGSPDAMLAAAVSARRSYDFPLAERLARFAVQSGAGFEAELLVAQLAGLLGRVNEAQSRLTALATTAIDDDQRSRVALSRLDSVHMRLQPGLYQQIVAEAEATITDPQLLDEVLARRSWLSMITDGLWVTAELAEPLLERGTGKVLVTAAVSAAVSFAYLGRIEEALEASRIGAEARRSLSTPLEWGAWIHSWTRIEALTGGGRYTEAEALATEEYREVLADGAPEAQAFMAWALARLNIERGLVRTAARFGQEAAALFRELGQPAGEWPSLIYQATACALGGQASLATEILTRTETLPEADSTLRCKLMQARAWTAVAEGDLPLARSLFQEAVELGEQFGDLTGATAALHSIARIGYPKDAEDRLVALVCRIEGDFAGARAAHVSALVAVDPPALEEASARFEANGALLLAGEAAADAATAWLRKGSPRQAASASRRSAALIDQCEGASTPAVQSVKARARLTPAERAAALLAARGRSNRQIAEELCVSVRTVESRLQHVYDKLGVAGRDELVDALQA